MAYEGVFGEAVDRIGGEPISARMARRAPVRHLDPSLLLVTLLLAGYGAIMVQSTTSSSESTFLADPNAFVKRQLAYLVAGVIVLWGLGTLAAWQPARRAAQVSPALATRTT